MRQRRGRGVEEKTGEKADQRRRGGNERCEIKRGLKTQFRGREDRRGAAGERKAFEVEIRRRRK